MQLFLIDDHEIDDLKVNLDKMTDRSHLLIDLKSPHQFLT